MLARVRADGLMRRFAFELSVGLFIVLACVFVIQVSPLIQGLS